MIAASRGKADTNKTGLHRVERRWFAVYTHYKREKSTVVDLERKGVLAYTPLISKTKRYTRKIKTLKIPLINNYVFVCISQEEYRKVLESRDVIKFLKTKSEFIAIPDEEIKMLERIVGESDEIQMLEFEPRTGQEVEIIHGKLTGLRGTIVQQKGKSQFVVDLEHVGMSLQLHVDQSMLARVT